MLRSLEIFGATFKVPDGAKRISIPSQTGSADAFMALTLTRGDAPVITISPSIPEFERLTDDLRILAQEANVRILEYPPIIEDDKSALANRLKAAAALRAWSVRPYPLVITAPIQSLENDVVPSDAKSFVLDLETGLFRELKTYLDSNGYSRSNIVEHEGDYSIRGDIVDFWSPGEAAPVRAEFFGENLESLRAFDLTTQISIERLEKTELMPVTIEEAPMIDDAPTGLLDILDDTGTVLALEHNEYNFAYPLIKQTRARVVFSGDPAPPGAAPCDFTTAPLPGFAEMPSDASRHPELFDSIRQRLERHLASAQRRNTHILELDELNSGFEIPGLIVVTKSDRVFTKRRAYSRKVQNIAGARLNTFEELEPGEYVVHVDHGVGKYVGSGEITLDGRRTEVFTIEYADGARLHVTAAHAHLISRYIGVKGEQVRLHKLDGKRWQRDKEEARRAVADLASSLLETQARRQIAPGFAYDVSPEGTEAFEAAFPYEETPDQLTAMEAIKADLAQTKPMDRLICGDAGYGKTELAMRAAYIAAMNGRQVAVLAPTTILAEQHFETFCARFASTPVRIETASRFQTPSAKAATFARLASGVCDIIIGTHAILSSKVRFHDLGLIIIDEEQRFGVRHKEHLKRLKATADVLTLSATPIPRTLYLSMTGVRDLSILRTPPPGRIAVETKIVRDSDTIVKSAIETELARGGQVYFLHNRVATISRVERRLRALCPKAKIAVAHGQMDAESLAERIHSFEQGRDDILLSTTIVESGIDIPRANTIIIDRADSFGLADLYQLRGRVGRSSRQGRAYLLLPPSGDTDSQSRERLKALQRHGGLGGGFNLAMRDLELRGAGNLLGSKQSGHIAAVGFTLYCQLLQRTISMLKGEKVQDIVDVKLHLDFIDTSPAVSDSPDAAVLPYAYIEEDEFRLDFLKRLAQAGSLKAVKAIADEMEDRFGRPPPAAKRFLRLAAFKILCAQRGYDRVDTKDRRAFFYKIGENTVSLVEDIKGSTTDAAIASLVKIVKDHA